jgi:hypothetical protein
MYVNDPVLMTSVLVTVEVHHYLLPSLLAVVLLNFTVLKADKVLGTLPSKLEKLSTILTDPVWN